MHYSVVVERALARFVVAGVASTGSSAEVFVPVSLV